MPQLRAGALRPLFMEWAAPGAPLQIVYPSNRYLSPKVRVFADFIAEVMPAKGYWPEVAALAARG